MNSNIKEIGHVSFKLKDTARFRDWYENTLGLNVGFVLQKVPGEDYIIYYQLHRGQFIEIFPESSSFSCRTSSSRSVSGLPAYRRSTPTIPHACKRSITSISA